MSSRRLSLLATLLLAALSSADPCRAGTFSQIGTSRWVTVSHVYDGDTFKTTSEEKIRLLGINTPELPHNDKPGQPLATQATQQLKTLILGKTVRLEFDRERKDSYDRLLAHVYLQNGLWINRQMVNSGMAHSYTFSPNLKYCRQLLESERSARKERIGIWNSEPFEPLEAADAGKEHIGQFRVISGKLSSIDKTKWSFKLEQLSISIPKTYRKWFKQPPSLKLGQRVVVHGKIRISNRGRLYLALHSPCDLEMMN